MGVISSVPLDGKGKPMKQSQLYNFIKYFKALKWYSKGAVIFVIIFIVVPAYLIWDFRKEIFPILVTKYQSSNELKNKQTPFSYSSIENIAQNAIENSTCRLSDPSMEASIVKHAKKAGIYYETGMKFLKNKQYDEARTQIYKALAIFNHPLFNLAAIDVNWQLGTIEEIPIRAEEAIKNIGMLESDSITLITLNCLLIKASINALLGKSEESVRSCERGESIVSTEDITRREFGIIETVYRLNLIKAFALTNMGRANEAEILIRKVMVEIENKEIDTYKSIYVDFVFQLLSLLMVDDRYDEAFCWLISIPAITPLEPGSAGYKLYLTILSLYHVTGYHFETAQVYANTLVNSIGALPKNGKNRAQNYAVAYSYTVAALAFGLSGKPQEAYKAANDAYEMIKILPDLNSDQAIYLKSYILTVLGISSGGIEKYTEAEIYLSMAIECLNRAAESVAVQEQKLLIYDFLSLVYWHNNNPVASREAKKKSETIELNKLKRVGKRPVGGDIADAKNCIKCYVAALKYFKKLPQNTAANQSNYANLLFLAAKQFDKRPSPENINYSILYYKEAEGILEQLLVNGYEKDKISHLYIQTVYRLGIAYFNRNDFENSILCFKKVNSLVNKYRDAISEFNIIENYLKISDVCFLMGYENIAVDCAEQALQYYQSNAARYSPIYGQKSREKSLDLARFYYGTGNLDKGDYYYELSRSRIFDMRNNEVITQKVIKSFWPINSMQK